MGGIKVAKANTHTYTSSVANAHAPYNFIPFEKQMVQVAKEKSELTKHDIFLDTDNLGEKRKTGKITYELNNVTELFIGGNTKEGKEGEKLFFGDDKKYIIPGSTIRGLVRANAQILSFSYPGDIEDRTMMYRSLAGNCVTVRKEYMYQMRGNDEKQVTSFHQSIKAGYLFWENEHKLCIIPAPEFKGRGRNFVKVHESDLRKNNVFTDERFYMYTKQIQKYRDCTFKGRTLSENEKKKEYRQGLQKYKKENYAPYGNQPFLKGGQSIRFTYEEKRITKLGEGQAKGYLFNSQWIDGKVNHYLINVLETKDLKESKNKLEIDKDKVISYEKDLERNKQQNKMLEKRDYFYNLPYENGKRAIGVKYARIFFYRTDRNGNITDFGPTPYFRNFYGNSICSGIQMKKEGLDFVDSIFGFIGEEEKEHYQGRVDFMNCIRSRMIKSESDISSLISMNPKPTSFQLYLQQKSENPRELITYNAKPIFLRGRKFYWKQGNVKKIVASKSESISTKIRPLKERQKFKGEIYFENLTESELGLILLALQWGEGCSDSIGYGKPYGYGTIEISNVRVLYEDKKKSFCNLESALEGAFLEDIALNEKEMKMEIGNVLREVFYQSSIDVKQVKADIVGKITTLFQWNDSNAKKIEERLEEISGIQEWANEIEELERKEPERKEKEEVLGKIREHYLGRAESELYREVYQICMGEKVGKLKARFIDEMNNKLGKEYKEMKSIKLYDTLQRMKSVQETKKKIDTSYMDIKEFKNRMPLPSAEKLLGMEK